MNEIENILVSSFNIKGYHQTARVSVLINGSPTAEFEIKKGVRQGGPLSQFIFIIAIEGLNIAMKIACQKGIFHGIKIPHSETMISHPFHVDDALFVGEWSQYNIKNLSRVLWCFQVASGMIMNFNKSRVFGI